MVGISDISKIYQVIHSPCNRFFCIKPEVKDLPACIYAVAYPERLDIVIFERFSSPRSIFKRLFKMDMPPPELVSPCFLVITKPGVKAFVHMRISYPHVPEAGFSGKCHSAGRAVLLCLKISCVGIAGYVVFTLAYSNLSCYICGIV